MKRIALLFSAVILARCAGAPPQPPVSGPRPAPEAAIEEKAIGTVKVVAASLNVRGEATASSEVIAQVRRGQRLVLLSVGEEWWRIRLGNGAVGFVAAQHVIREGAPRARRGCPADADYSFAKAPIPSFIDHAPHGMVTVEASVDTSGKVTSTKVISNTTGDESLGTLASREIRNAKFTPPIRNCVAKAFIFTYKRSF